MPVFIALVLPSVFAHCALAWHHKGHHPYLPPGHSGRSTPQCSGSPCRLVQQTGTHASNTFSLLSGDPSTTSQRPPEPTPRGSQPQEVAAGFLHPVQPQTSLLAGYPAASSVKAQALLPAEYPVDYPNCLADPDPDAN